jgi:hypothetical protein
MASPAIGLNVVVGEAVELGATGKRVAVVSATSGPTDDAQADSANSPTTRALRTPKPLMAHTVWLTARFHMMLTAYNRERAPLRSHLNSMFHLGELWHTKSNTSLTTMQFGR